MMSWIYRKKEITKIDDLKKSAIGFIYEIEFSNGKKYLGRKALYHNRKLKPLKGYKRKRKVVVESDWLTYNGSFTDEKLKDNLKSEEIIVVSKKIIKVCETLWEMSYYETKFLFENDCLLNMDYYNNNIMGKFYRPKTKK